MNLDINKSQPTEANVKHKPTQKSNKLDIYKNESPSKPTPRPHARPIPPDDEHAHNAEQRDSRQDIHTFTDAQILIHIRGHHNEDGGRRGPGEVIPRQQRSHVLRIRRRQVHQDALEGDEGAACVQGDADSGDDPVDGFPGGPGEEEEADGGDADGGEGGEEACFKVVGADEGLLRGWAAEEVYGVEGGGDDAADDDGDEDQGEGEEGHLVGVHVDEVEGLEEGVVDGVDEGGVEAGEADGGVFDADFDGAGEGLAKVSGEGDWIELRGRENGALMSRVSVLAPETAGSVEEDGLAEGLREEAGH